MSSVGRIKIEVLAPYPAWCKVYIDEAYVGTLHHCELSDLKYATEQAMKEARLLLGDDKDEV